jgi:hypothetical protein
MVITTRVLGPWSALLVVVALCLGGNRPKGLVFHYCDVEGFFAISQGSKLVRSEKARDVLVSMCAVEGRNVKSMAKSRVESLCHR